MRKEEDNEYKVFSFLKPFNANLWLAIVFTTIGVGVFLWLHSTFSPYGFHGRVVQSRDPAKLPSEQVKAKNRLSIANAIWSSFAYYVGQGPDVPHPVSLSGRISAGIWWFAVLIIGTSLQLITKLCCVEVASCSVDQIVKMVTTISNVRQKRISPET